MGRESSRSRAEQTPAIMAAIDSNELTAVTVTDAEFADVIAFLHAITSSSLPAADIQDRVLSGLPLVDRHTQWAFAGRTAL